MFCRNCGNKLEEDALFCMNCGVKISDDTSSKYCVHCGNELEEDAVFCMKCGNRVREEDVKSAPKSDAVSESVPIHETAKEETEITEKTQVEVGNTAEAEIVKDDTEAEFFIVAKDMKKFAAMRGDNDSNYYCPNCHNQVNPASDSCTKCGVSFYDWRTNEKSNGNASAKMEETPFSANTGSSKSQSRIGYFFLAIFVLIGIAIIAGLVYQEQKNPWTGTDTLTGMDEFNLDILNAKTETFTSNDGDVEIVNCYKISDADFEKLWKSIPNVSLIYGGTNWYPFDPEYDKIDDYNQSIKSLMRKYDILCSQVYHYDDGGSFVWTYLINRKTGQVMAF